MLRIRLSRYGKKDRPTWRVVVVESTRTGKGRVADYIGSYNPMVTPKQFQLDGAKYDQWVKNGAQPTDAVVRLKGRMIDKSPEYKTAVKTKIYVNAEKEAAKKAEAEAKLKAEQEAQEAAKQAEIDAAAAAEAAANAPEEPTAVAQEAPADEEAPAEESPAAEPTPAPTEEEKTEEVAA